MKAKPHQIEGAKEALPILTKYGIVYLAWEERTGKSITDLLICEQLDWVKKALIISKKKALDGWKETLAKFEHEKVYSLINYHSVNKIKGKFDIIILDEAHSNISGYPLRAKIWKDIYTISQSLPIIYNSATPHAQGYQLLVNQFALTKYGPWNEFKDFYAWFKHFAQRDESGQLPTKRISPTQTVVDYTKIREQDVIDSCKHLFTTRTRKQLNFEQEPEDILHWIELSPKVKEIYNHLVDKKLLQFTHSQGPSDKFLLYP